MKNKIESFGQVSNLFRAWNWHSHFWNGFHWSDRLPYSRVHVTENMYFGYKDNKPEDNYLFSVSVRLPGIEDAEERFYGEETANKKYYKGDDNDVKEFIEKSLGHEVVPRLPNKEELKEIAHRKANPPPTTEELRDMINKYANLDVDPQEIAAAYFEGVRLAIHHVRNKD